MTLLRGQSRGSSAINMFSNSKMSEIDPRGGVSIFQISLKYAMKPPLNDLLVFVFFEINNPQILR